VSHIPNDMVILSIEKELVRCPAPVSHLWTLSYGKLAEAVTVAARNVIGRLQKQANVVKVFIIICDIIL